ncbi:MULTISPECIES: DUF2334 domain-containing protein [unclassified Dehalobacter]|uniref:DUF2334 domain-containing protein n=1 Tax=unclassified Dehalobacter TaxID=2635733 RepID=UPI000E6CE0AE|nr:MULTISPECIES: DUF2334 domain-containing protein [unclassified Dehalobacter]RJE46521.1 hypothetical protein A7K50_13145 [Dehalobacter sp. MCB1]TCX49465.1 hypothetical protein C1I38_13910 [Dehalobacter sp. 12DCB1]TCX49967.1 hypothetical protein C1I36_09050 [Dehalobacter sp. 14DCB1]
MFREKVFAIALTCTLFLTVIAHSSLSTRPSNISKEQFSEKLPALLRLEDVGPGEEYTSQENLDKLIVLADYLKQEGIPFEVSLIPRMVVPGRNYDVAITDHTEYARKFVSTIKSLEEKGGIIGVHGYTHQSGNSNSVSGYEFYSSAKNPDVPNTYAYAKERAEKAIALFDQAGIRPAYWETPHYSASPQQLVAFQEQIGLIYENNYYYPEAWKSNSVVNQHQEYYCGLDVVPAPLGHLNSPERLAAMLAVLDDPAKNGTLASLYVHPTYEFQFIKKVQQKNGEVQYIYDENSLLHQLVKELKNRRYAFVSIYSLVGFVPAQRAENIQFDPRDEVFTGQFVTGASGKNVLIWNKKTNQWHMFRYSASWYAPRKDINAFQDLGVWLKDLSLDSGTIPIVGYFKNKDKQDLLLLNTVSGSMILAENNGNKFIPNYLKWQALNDFQNVDPVAGELNGDGLTDLLLYDRDNGRIGRAINQGGCFSDITWQSFNLLKAKSLKLLTGDFNGDGTSDILGINFDTDTWQVLVGVKAHGFSLSPKRWNSQFSISRDFKLFAADINGDNKDDVMVHSPDGLWKSFTMDGREFVSGGSFGPWGSGNTEVALADINGDQKADLIMINHSTGTYNLNSAISVLGK